MPVSKEDIEKYDELFDHFDWRRAPLPKGVTAVVRRPIYDENFNVEEFMRAAGYRGPFKFPPYVVAIKKRIIPPGPRTRDDDNFEYFRGPQDLQAKKPGENSDSETSDSDRRRVRVKTRECSHRFLQRRENGEPELIEIDDDDSTLSAHDRSGTEGRSSRSVSRRSSRNVSRCSSRNASRCSSRNVSRASSVRSVRSGVLEPTAMMMNTPIMAERRRVPSGTENSPVYVSANASLERNETSGEEEIDVVTVDSPKKSNESSIKTVPIYILGRELSVEHGRFEIADETSNLAEKEYERNGKQKNLSNLSCTSPGRELFGESEPKKTDGTTMTFSQKQHLPRGKEWVPPMNVPGDASSGRESEADGEAPSLAKKKRKRGETRKNSQENIATDASSKGKEPTGVPEPIQTNDLTPPLLEAQVIRPKTKRGSSKNCATICGKKQTLEATKSSTNSPYVIRWTVPQRSTHSRYTPYFPVAQHGTLKPYPYAHQNQSIMLPHGTPRTMGSTSASVETSGLQGGHSRWNTFSSQPAQFNTPQSPNVDGYSQFGTDAHNDFSNNVNSGFNPTQGVGGQWSGEMYSQPVDQSMGHAAGSSYWQGNRGFSQQASMPQFPSQNEDFQCSSNAYPIDGSAPVAYHQPTPADQAQVQQPCYSGEAQDSFVEPLVAHLCKDPSATSSSDDVAVVEEVNREPKTYAQI
ncbi:hypothetical protein Q1695_001180 [Nippostrongylus brasiliensis]|nr:hypothetical protein Q1695_001180 [Nippostrongylus brasiliensis]